MYKILGNAVIRDRINRQVSFPLTFLPKMGMCSKSKTEYGNIKSFSAGTSKK